MPTFRKRPIEIEAVQFVSCDPEGGPEGEHQIRFATEIPEWMQEALEDEAVVPSGLYADTLDVVVLTGRLVAKPGDWLLKGIEDEIYVCPDSIFRASYDEVG